MAMILSRMSVLRRATLSGRHGLEVSASRFALTRQTPLGFSFTRTLKSLAVTAATVTAARALCRSSRSKACRRCQSRFNSASANSSFGNAEFLWDLLYKEKRRLALEAPNLSPELRRKLEEAFSQVTAEDLGVRESDAACLRSMSGVGYQEIYAGSEMTLAIFLLRAGARIPLHDHPGMTVIGRLLFGRMRVRSYTFIDSDSNNGSWLGARMGSWQIKRKVRPSKDEVIGPSPVSYSLEPVEGNIHEIEALENCAFFDLLTPPYDSRKNRSCTYYRHVAPRTKIEVDDPSEMLEVFEPPGFDMDYQVYRGPRFA
eukprot:TRINITY_DN1260_c1_g1_i1.p1 TRINITY_DN1260_c1_g1~~TRINITY_DN1260_c1_g1_i1.p1  ORF type:complete len:326 (-),score=36.79 TRINITY_DN1260_c1_g1_i1:282-1223(-)